MIIKTLDLSRLRNGEHFQFHTDFKELLDKATAEALNVKLDFEQYCKLYEDEDEILEKIRKSATTQPISDADTTRDITFRGFADAISAALKHFNAEVRESARKLKILLDSYGNVVPLPYNEETAKIYNLVQEMKKDYAADITLLKLEDWVQELDKNNKAFEQLMNQRYDEQAGKPEQNSREIRLQIDPVYRNITEAINVYARVTPKPEYDEFIQALNLRIDYYNNTLVLRVARKKGKEDKGENGGSEKKE